MIRAFLGPTSISGLEWEYRNGLRKLGVDARVVLSTPNNFNYNYDKAFWNKNGFGSSYIAKIMGAINFPINIHNFDLFHFSFGNSILPYNLDVPFLHKMRKGIVMAFVGSDIRCNLDVLNGKLKSSNCSFCKKPCRIEKKKRIVKYWAKNANVITSGVDNSQILDHYGIPWVHIPVPIDIEYWKPFSNNVDLHKDKDAITIVHAPSDPLLKGTPLISKTIEELSKKHKIDYKLLMGIPNSCVREWLNNADIVVDQFGCGWHGKFSVESMSLAKPTLCSIDESIKRRFPKFKDLPIVNITPDTLYDKLESLIINPDLRFKIGENGRKYAEKIHDNNMVCQDLLKVYERAING